MTTSADINRAARDAHPNPSAGQKMTGNYRKGHVRLHGLDIAIETPRGATRSGVTKDGEEWSSKSPSHYGYIKRSRGADDDHVDVYIGPHPKSDKVYVVDQVDADSRDFDEHKVMLGYANRAQALKDYRAAFSDDRGHQRIGKISEMNVADFKDWLRNDDTTKPLMERASGGRVNAPFPYWDNLPSGANEMAALRVQRSVRSDKKQNQPEPSKEMASQLVSKEFASGGTVADDWITPQAPQADDWVTPTAEQKAAAISVRPTPSTLEKTIEPITSYNPTRRQMVDESLGQMSEGVDQLTTPAQRFDPVRDAAPPESEAWRKAKGAGNVALGALGYVASPINAALRTMVGKPVEENFGVPKEYTEFVTSLAVPGLGLTSAPRATAAAATKMQEVAEAASRLGVRIPRAAATESVPIQATAGALKEVPVVGAPLVKASKNALADMDRVVGDTVSGYGSGQPLAAGEAAIEGIENWIGGQSTKVADRLYGNVEKLVDPVFERPLHATDKVVADIMAKRANAKISGASPAVNEVLDAINSPGMNYEGLKNLRSYIGEMTPEEMVAKGISKGEAKRIYGALSEDLRGTVLDAGGPDALKAFDKASSTYEQIAEKRKALAKIIGVKADASPERALARIQEMASSKGGANYQALVQVRRAVGPEKWDEITSAIVNRMGREKPGAEFSGDRFKTAWDAMPDNTKRLVLNSTGKPELARNVEDIMTLSGAHRSLQRYGNPSGTGRVATLGGMAGALWAAPVAAISTAVGGNVLARILASPVAAKQAAKWSLTYSNAAKNPSPGRMMVLGTASENLAKAINRDIGGNFTGADFMRRLQGPVPAGADQEQP